MTVTPRARRLGLIPLLLLIGVLSLVGAAGAAASELGYGGGAAGSTGSGGGVVTPDDPIVSDPPEPWPIDPPPGDGAIHVTPEPGINDPHPHVFDHVTVSADGRTLTAYYWGGVEACYGLHSATATRNADGSYTITILEGWRDIAAEFACIDIAVLKAVDITIDEPIFIPGAVDLPVVAE